MVRYFSLGGAQDTLSGVNLLVSDGISKRQASIDNRRANAIFSKGTEGWFVKSIIKERSAEDCLFLVHSQVCITR